ncbi:MAG: hypothetical protein WA766_14120 [Candidatus Acidiferrales bacterium]
MPDPNQAFKLMGEETLRDLLKVLPVDAVLKFRERTKQVHAQQLSIIQDSLAEKGYKEPHLEKPSGGYHD